MSSDRDARIGPDQKLYKELSSSLSSSLWVSEEGDFRRLYLDTSEWSAPILPRCDSMGILRAPNTMRLELALARAWINKDAKSATLISPQDGPKVSNIRTESKESTKKGTEDAVNTGDMGGHEADSSKGSQFEYNAELNEDHVLVVDMDEDEPKYSGPHDNRAEAVPRRIRQVDNVDQESMVGAVVGSHAYAGASQAHAIAPYPPPPLTRRTVRLNGVSPCILSVMMSCKESNTMEDVASTCGIQLKTAWSYACKGVNAAPFLVPANVLIPLINAEIWAFVLQNQISGTLSDMMQVLQTQLDTSGIPCGYNQLRFARLIRRSELAGNALTPPGDCL